MTDFHQNENRSRDALPARDAKGRPLSTADLAAAAQRPDRPEKPGDPGRTPATDASSATGRADEQRRESQRQARRDGRREAGKQGGAPGGAIADNEDTGVFEPLDTNRQASSANVGRDPNTRGSAAAGAVENTSAKGRTTGRVDAEGESETLEPLFTPDRAETYRSRWVSIQSGFVDDPRQAVRSGDELVAEVMANLANTFAEERHRMEAQIDETGEGATENLRLALRRYRSFFDRLLSL